MFKRFILTSSFLILTFLFHAQTGKIVGKIVDSKTGETLPGATVLIEGTTKGASSDFDGNFSLAGLQPGKYTIIASYITYDNKKLLDNKKKINSNENNIKIKKEKLKAVNILIRENIGDKKNIYLFINAN